MGEVSGRDARVLMIDDDEDTFVLTQAMLGQVDRHAYSLDWQPTPEQGLTALLTGEYDACLLDVHLGGANGLEVLDRAMEQGCETPIIVLTGSFGRIRSDAAIVRAGASDFLSKHRLTPEALDRSVRYAIERQRLMASLQAERRELAASEGRLNDLIQRLTGDLAHELNNVLTVVLANAQLLREVVPPASIDDLEAIIEAAARGGVMIENLRHAGTQPRPTSIQDGVSSLAATAGAQLCVLLVEDENDIRRTARRILERSGYRVLEAHNGREALTLLAEAEAGPAVDLILSDIVMPEVGGHELAKRLQEMESTIPITFMTGYDPSSDGMDPGILVLRKPWTLDELLEHVRQALAQRPR